MRKTKNCHRCSKRYPATNEFFNRGSGYRDGLINICKKCKREARPPEIAEKERERLHRAYEKRKHFQNERREAKRKANPGMFAERQRRWKDKCSPEAREAARAKAREYYLKNTDNRLRYARERREKVRAEILTIIMPSPMQ